MRTATILFALCFSCFIIGGLTVTGTLTVNDNLAANGVNYPLAVKTGTDAALSIDGTTKTATVTAGSTYTGVWTKGVPLASTYGYTTATTGTAKDAEFVVVALTVGSRLVSVTNNGGTGNVGTEQAQGATFTAASLCGDYFLNGVTGVVTINIVADCVVTITQVAGVSGVIQYNVDTLSTAQKTSICNGIEDAAEKVSGVTNAMCEITGTASGSILAYYGVTATGATTNTQLSSVAASIQSVIYAKTITVDSATQLNGFALPIATSATAGTAAPSTTTTASLAAAAAAAKSHSRMVVIAGVFSTVLAAFFGLAF